MKNCTSRAFFILFLCSFLFACKRYPSQRETPSNSRKKSAKYDNIQNLLEQEFRLTRDPQLNAVPTDRLLAAKEYRDQRFRLNSNANIMGPVSGINWAERGPSNVGGRTRALWFDLNDVANGYKKVWAAGVAGGLWYTNDITAASPSWVKIDDFLDNLAITTFVQNPTNPLEMYFGTGEGWLNSDYVRGLGIWKSSDGGVTWNHLASTNNVTIFFFVQKMAIDASGNVYACTQQGGLQKSTDGGTTWTKVLGLGVGGGLPGNTAVSNIAADVEIAANGDVYCSFGISSPGDIYRSTDGGTTWTDISSYPGRRIELACAPSDPNTVYALYQSNANGNCHAIRRYNASTGTWTDGTVPTIVDQGSNSNFTRGQAWYDLIAAVDPNNANTLYIGGVDALRSDDGGATWTQMSTWSLFGAPAFTVSQYIHADHHAIVYAPGSSSRAIWGTDGGVYYTSDANITGAGNKPTFISKNTGYNITQYYSGAIHPTSTNYFLAGAQDNGSHKFGSAGINSVTLASGGDGGFCHIDQDDPSIQITSYVYNNYYVSTNGGVTFSSQFKNNRGDFINASDYDDAANILYAGDAAGNYYRWNDPASNGPDQQVSVPQLTSWVSHVAVSPITPNRIYLGMGNGSVVKVDNANTGSSKTGTVLKTGVGVISCIAVDPSNENHLLITSTTYGVTSIFETFDAQSTTPTWSSVEGDLPDMPVRWAMFDPRNSDWALIATNLGVWSTDNLNSGGTTNWSPTNSGLANVRVDMLQYRSSDRTILAVTHGRGAFTATVPQVLTPDINFSAAIVGATEGTTSSNTCRRYTDYNVSLTIANPPTGDAVVTVNASAGNAVQGVDYDYTLNGDFSSPTASATFFNGTTTAKTVTVRIYNDAEIESVETVTLSYSLSGLSDAQEGSGPQTCTFSITDNDDAPTPAGAYAIGTYTDDLQWQSIFPGWYEKHRIQSLYRASELAAAGLSGPTSITAMTVNVVAKYSTQPFSGFTISMANSSSNNLSTGFSPSTFTTVYSGNYSSVMGDNTFNFTTPFAWDGVSNIIVQVCFDNSAFTPDADADLMEGSTPFAYCVTYADYTLSGSPAGCDLDAEWVDHYRIKATFSAGTPIASALNTTRGENFARNNDLYVYSNTGDIMARIRNLSGTHNYGCTDVIIDRAGTTSKPFWNNNTANRVMDKTFRIIPSSNDPSGNYEVTLYYTMQEVSGWETETGQSFNNIQLIKVAGQVSDVTPANPGGGGTVEIVTPTRGTFGNGYTLTYTFNSGFSGFGAGVAGAALPVSILDFTGKLKNNSVQLDWTTSQEINNQGFDVERSYDGTNFTKIGYVKGAGNSYTRRSYTFTDKDIAQDNNYYRLRQIDIDNRYEYSKVVLINNKVQSKQAFSVLNNPVGNNLDIQFETLPKGKVVITLTDLQGRKIQSWNGETINKRIRLNLDDTRIAAGIYMVHVIVDSRRYSQKIIKK